MDAFKYKMNNSLEKLLVLFLALIMVFSCETDDVPNNQFTVSGEITGLDMNLFYRHPDREYSREYPSDTIFVTNGKFSFTDTINELKMMRAYTGYTKDNKLYKIANGGGYYPVKSMYLMFFASPGANIKVSGEATDFINAYPSGDDYNNSLTAINKKAFPVYNESGNLLVSVSHETDPVKKAALRKQSDSISKVGIEDRKEYLRENPESMGALWYLDDMIMRRQVTDNEAIDLFNNVSENLKETTIYNNIETRIKGIMATKEGMPVPEIKTKSTPDGAEFDMASLRGKHVLIDFWGVWCGPCVAEMPTVQAYQEKYKDKLVVLGINSGDTQEKMENYLDTNGYDWQQLMNVRDNSSDNFVSRFNVQGFPTKFIIDPEGIIVKRFLGSTEEAFTMLDELLQD